MSSSFSSWTPENSLLNWSIYINIFICSRIWTFQSNTQWSDVHGCLVITMIEILILPEIDQLVTRLIIFWVTGRVHLSQYCTSSREIATYNLQRSPNSPRRLPIGNLESLSQHYKLGLFALDISLQTIYGNDKFHRKFNTPSWILIHIHM